MESKCLDEKALIQGLKNKEALINIYEDKILSVCN